MHIIENKKTSMKVAEGDVDYAHLINALISQPSNKQSGLSYDEMRRSIKVGDITAAAKKSLEKSVTAVETVRAITKNYNDMLSAIGGTRPVKLSMKIDEFAKKMNVSTPSVKINNTPIKITLNLDLTMDADEIAYKLSNPSGGRKWVI